MENELTKKELEFANQYLETGNGTQSALKAYDIETEGKTKEQIDNVAASIASQNLRKLKVQAYLEDKAELAATRVEQLMEQSDNLNVALSAAKDILDRAGYKPVDRTDHTTQGEKINFNVVNYDK